MGEASQQILHHGGVQRNATCTLGHLLSACPKSLDRFTFRHNSVLSHLLNTIVQKKKEGIEVFADLNGWRINGGTVPPDLALTEQKPDLVVIDKSAAPKKVLLIELTVPCPLGLRPQLQSSLGEENSEV